MAGAYTITVLPTLKVFVPRIELGTSRVLGERHNQLDHTNTMEYLGFDPSTSSLLRTHASDCANTPALERFVRSQIASAQCARTAPPRVVRTSRLAQLVERKTLNLVVVGSSPTVGAFFRVFPRFVFVKVYRTAQKRSCQLLWRSWQRVGLIIPRSRVRSSPGAYLFFCAVSQ